MCIIVDKGNEESFGRKVTLAHYRVGLVPDPVSVVLGFSYVGIRCARKGASIDCIPSAFSFQVGSATEVTLSGMPRPWDVSTPPVAERQEYDVSAVSRAVFTADGIPAP